MSILMKETKKQKASSSMQNKEHLSVKKSAYKNNDDFQAISNLHSSIGNQATQKLLNSTAIQAKLTLSSPSDSYEKEADRVADEVLNMSNNTIQKHSPVKIQRKTMQSSNIDKISPSIESKINSLHGKGVPLSRETKSFFNPRFGHDLSDVRIHTDSNSNDLAQSINARAFTKGNHIVFNKGEYNPQSTNGKRLLGHELTHILQQNHHINRQALPKTASKVVADGEQKIRNQAGRISDKYQALLIRYAGALHTFNNTLTSASSKDIKSQFGKVMLDYVSDQVIGKIAGNISGASYVYDIYKAIQLENKRVQQQKEQFNISKFFKKHNKWITKNASNLKSKETESKMEAVKHYKSLTDNNKKVIYWHKLKLKADNLDRHLKKMTQDKIFILFSEKWISNSKTTYFRNILMSAYIEIRLDTKWNVSKAYIHAPGGQKIADELNSLTPNISPLALKTRKVIYAKGYNLPGPYKNTPYQVQLNANNRYTGDNLKLYKKIKELSIPKTNKWSGD